VSAALFDYQGDVTHPLVKVDPALITLERIPQAQLVAMQARASKAVWRPAPGRKNSYAVKHAGRIVGLMFLASPVINLGMSACVGLQPIAWHWNIGKLVAILATSNEIAADHEARYGDHLDWITTTSLYGRGAQYNRIYKFLGYSKGYGHAHVSEAEYQRMLAYMRDEGIEIPSSAFGAGSNPRMRRIAAYQRATGQKVALKHGDKRGVYIHAAAQGSVRELAAAWHARWGAPRYERTKDQQPPYTDGMAS
jgi:chemotaxis receptor (MCP) glutamine deamidase CheD